MDTHRSSIKKSWVGGYTYEVLEWFNHPYETQIYLVRSRHAGEQIVYKWSWHIKHVAAHKFCVVFTNNDYNN